MDERKTEPTLTALTNRLSETLARQETLLRLLSTRGSSGRGSRKLHRYYQSLSVQRAKLEIALSKHGRNLRPSEKRLYDAMHSEGSLSDLMVDSLTAIQNI